MFTMPIDMVGGLSGNPDQDWQVFGDAYDSVVSKLPDWAQQNHADWIVLRSMAESLHDGHTSFLTPDEAARSHETSFAGIGVLMSRPQDNQPPLIAEIFPNSPAASSGLKRGDRIVGVDGQDVTGQSVGDVASLIRGQPGTRREDPGHAIECAAAAGIHDEARDGAGRPGDWSAGTQCTDWLPEDPPVWRPVGRRQRARAFWIRVNSAA